MYVQKLIRQQVGGSQESPTEQNDYRPVAPPQTSNLLRISFRAYGQSALEIDFTLLLLGCITHENNRKQRSLELRSSFLSPSTDYSRAWISLQVKGTYFLLTCPNSFLKMKTPKQIEKTRILETVKLLTNLGRHQEASKLFNQHFGV